MAGHWIFVEWSRFCGSLDVNVDISRKIYGVMEVL